jgi:hypothetical protein
MSGGRLTEQERIDLGRALGPLEDDDSPGPLEWHPCHPECGPCACSGVLYLGPEMTAAIERIVARRESEAAEKALREAADAWFTADDHRIDEGQTHLWLRARADSVAQGREETP